MALFIGAELVSIIIIAFLLLTNDHLKKRDTIESKRIFGIAVLSATGSLINTLITIYDFYGHVEPGTQWYVAHAFLMAFSCCLKEMMSLQIMISWNLFVDYGINRSYDHVIKKYRRILIPCIVISVLFIAVYTITDSFAEYTGTAVSVMTGFIYLCEVLQLVMAVNAVWIVISAKQRRKPPSFLRLDVFIIPVALGYILNLIPAIPKCDYRSICTAIAVVLTWRSVKKRYQYVDPFTGFYNRAFLSSMNEYMEKSGYPNGIGVYFRAPESNGKLIPVLDALKPADSEIFSLGEDEYLLLAGPQKESVIRLLIKSIELKAAEENSSLKINSAFCIREENESTEAFTKRLLEL